MVASQDKVFNWVSSSAGLISAGGCGGTLFPIFLIVFKYTKNLAKENLFFSSGGVFFFFFFFFPCPGAPVGFQTIR